MKHSISRMIFFNLLACCWIGCAGSAYLRVSSEEVAPGVTHTHYRTAAPHEIHVVSVDLRNPALNVETVRANGLVPISRIVAETSTPDRPIVAAVNADFFSFTSRWPVGNQVSKGEIVTGIKSRRSHFLIMSNGHPRIEQISFTGEAVSSSHGRWTIDQLNQPLGRRGSVLYTARWSDSVQTLGGRAVWLTSISSRDRWIVDSLGEYSGIAAVKSAMLAFGARAIDSLGTNFPRAGDTLAVTLGFRPSVGAIAEAVGGGGRILYNGIPWIDANAKTESVSLDFVTRRHPRTFIGISPDSATAYLCVVDGRQETSVGMSFEEMADFLLSLGAWQAVNLDGGGSSTMVVNGRVVNSPSDKTGERPVANVLVIRRTL